MTPLQLLRLSARAVAPPPPPPSVAPAPSPVSRAGGAARAVRRAKRIAEATTPAEWLEAHTEWCQHDVLLRDANGARGTCGWGCKP